MWVKYHNNLYTSKEVCLSTPPILFKSNTILLLAIWFIRLSVLGPMPLFPILFPAISSTWSISILILLYTSQCRVWWNVFKSLLVELYLVATLNYNHNSYILNKWMLIGLNLLKCQTNDCNMVEWYKDTLVNFFSGTAM